MKPTPPAQAARAPKPPPKPAAKPLARQGVRLFDPSAPYLVPLAVALVARVWQGLMIPFGAEDAYITFRFAENWGHGLGPVYNAGERVMGFSSPLWTAWLALGSVVFGPVFTFARVSGAVLDLGALLLGCMLLEEEHGRWSAWIFGLFFAIHPIFAANSVLGMETSLFLFLLMASAWAVGHSPRAAGVLIGLLALVRPEGVLAAGIVALAVPARQRLAALGLAALGFGALALYYGSPIPQSVLAKAATYGIVGPLAGLQWVEGLLPWFVGRGWPVTAEGQNLLPLALVGTPAAVAGAALLWRNRAKQGAAWIVAVVGMAILAGYFFLGVPFFYWYMVVPVAAWAWLAAIGLPLISRHRLLYASLMLYLISDTILLRNLYVGRVKQEVLSFYRVGAALKVLSGGKGSVFLEPIGHIGYLTRMRIIDEVGLVSPAVARRRVQGPGWYADVVAREQPDYLVVREGFFKGNESFAGVSAPFRGDGERDALLGSYDQVDLGRVTPPLNMAIYHRRPGT